MSDQDDLEEYNYERQQEANHQEMKFLEEVNNQMMEFKDLEKAIEIANEIINQDIGIIRISINPGWGISSEYKSYWYGYMHLEFSNSNTVMFELKEAMENLKLLEVIVNCHRQELEEQTGKIMTYEELAERDNEELLEIIRECNELLQDRTSDAYNRQFDWDRTAEND